MSPPPEFSVLSSARSVSSYSVFSVGILSLIYLARKFQPRLACNRRLMGPAWKLSGTPAAFRSPFCSRILPIQKASALSDDCVTFKRRQSFACFLAARQSHQRRTEIRLKGLKRQRALNGLMRSWPAWSKFLTAANKQSHSSIFSKA
jgi:hypothetical protein